jgi:MFS family permease
MRREYIGLCLLGSLSSLGLFAVHPILALYVKQLGVSYGEIGYFFSAYSFVWVFLQIYAGHLCDRYGRKRFILIGLLTYASFAFLCFRAQTFLELLFFRMMQGVGLGLFGPASLGLVGGFKEKGKSMAIYRTSEAIGIVLGPILGGFIGEMRLSYPFLISMCAGFAATISLPLLRERESGAESESFFGSVKAMVKLKGFLYICVAAFVAELCFASFDIVIPIVGNQIGFSAKKIGFLIASYFAAFSLFQVPIGMLSEKVSRKRLIVVSAAISSMGFLALVVANSFWPMILAMALLGITLGAVFVQSTALIAEIAPKGKKSLYLAFFDSIIDVSFVVMPPAVGWILFSGAKSPFILCVVLMMASSILFWRSGEMKSQESKGIDRRLRGG